jgi:hypothetical protein
MFKTIDDVRKYIISEYGVSPEKYDGKTITYRALTITKNEASIILANKKSADMWTVQRKGHSVDFFRTDELASALDHGGSLLYWFMQDTENS